jgi:hypothetical protein
MKSGKWRKGDQKVRTTRKENKKLKRNIRGKWSGTKRLMLNNYN